MRRDSLSTASASDLLVDLDERIIAKSLIDFKAAQPK
jgi:hypothetical protein